MRSQTLLLTASAALLAGMTAATIADDGERLVRQMSSSPGQVANPEPEGEHAYTQMLNFYVPAQAANGELLLDGIDYFTADDAETPFKTELNAKPLISFYLYGPVIGFEDPATSGFPGHGRRDAFAAVSLDDGATWKRTNLSESADKSSFETDTAIPDPAVAAPEFVVTSPTPITTSALYNAKKKTLTISGTGAVSKSTVEIRNAVTFAAIGTARAKPNGTFTLTLNKVATTAVPCSVQAGYTTGTIWGPYLDVVGAPTTCLGPDEVTEITDYPGDVTNGIHAMAGNKIIAAWQSKFCSSGFPAWSAEFARDEVSTYLGLGATDLYLTDLFVVAGSQGSTNYIDQEEVDGEYDDVGEVPHSCLWTARGVLRENPEAPGTSEVVWFKAERLTSGRRDVNRIETACVAGAGCAVTWQEDPEGLRPGEGEGPGTGWAGATTASQTDVWYSFIRWEDFDVVDINGEPVLLADERLDTGRPKPYVPMMVAARLTNNARCQTDSIEGYCSDAAIAYGLRDQCVDTIDIPLGPQGTPQAVCVVDSNNSGAGNLGDMPNVANTASSRPRLSLQPRDSDGDGFTDDAWVMVFAEEDKGLGRYAFPNDEEWNFNIGTTASETCVGVDPDADKEDECEKADTGKNIWWFSFAMGGPNTSAGIGVDYSLVSNLVSQGDMLNQPEVNWRTGTFYPPMSTEQMWNFGDYNYLVFNTEIARRSSMMAQSLGKALSGDSGLVALPLWKQGIVNQGGPADIMARRFVIDPETVDETKENPYDFANMACEYSNDAGDVVEGTKYFTDGSNPYYPKGLCMAPAINLSGRTPFECAAGSSSADGVCPGESYTCTEKAGFGQLCVPEDVTPESDENPENTQVFDKLLAWYECPGSNGVNSGTRTDQPACGVEPVSQLLGSNQNDQSWYNPLEIAKGHRGFLDGDFVQMLYAWSPNFKDNAVGRDRYELYVRRSFDGGATWTTTPESFTASDGEPYNLGSGTTTCDTWRDGADSLSDSHVCTTYAAGEAEQSRNVSQLTSNRFTILDPRYTPTGTNLGVSMVPFDGADLWLNFTPVVPTDYRNPTRYFVVFETGDNTTTAVGEAEPLDLNYMRGVMFGDHYQVWAEEDDLSLCFPNDPHGDDKFGWASGLGFCNEFDGLEEKKDDTSGEASVTASAYGDFLYGVWEQATVDEEGEFVEGDAMFRRVWYLDDYIPSDAWTSGEGQQ